MEKGDNFQRQNSLPIIDEQDNLSTSEHGMTELINPDENTIQERIRVPKGFKRIKAEEDSFGRYLRNLPLKPHGSKILYYNGEVKNRDVHLSWVFCMVSFHVQFLGCCRYSQRYGM
jgi:hypothetical protein